MSADDVPLFLTLELVMMVHHDSLVEHGGVDGARDPGAVEAAVAAGLNTWFYQGGDVLDIAATYAFHLAEAQAILDGNKRTAIASALFFCRPTVFRESQASPSSTTP